MKNRTFILLCLAVLTCTYTIAQPVVRQKQWDAGGKYDDDFSTMALTKDKGWIAGGFSYSDISCKKTENSRAGSWDYWIVKYDSSGNIEWDKTIGGNSADELRALQQTNDSGYIIGGGSFSNISDEKTENSRGGDDYWIVKLDKSGSIQWDKTIGGNDADNLYALQQTTDGGYILGGYSNSGISGEKTEDSRGGGADYWIVKIDANGNKQWDKTIGGRDGDFLTSLLQTSDGGYMVGGSSWSYKSGEKTEDSRGHSDYWIVKLDSKGNIQWDKTIGGSSWDYLYAFQQTSNNGYILGGYSSSNISGEKTENTRGYLGADDYWIVKLDSTGKIQWDKTIGGSDGDQLYSLQQTKDKGYIIGGLSNSNKSFEKTENSRGDNDYWIIKVDKAGKVQWDKTIGGNNRDECYSVKEISRDRYLIGGVSRSIISGDKTVGTCNSSKGYWDYWMVKLYYKTPDSSPTTILPVKLKTVMPDKKRNSSFSIYPNPARDVLHVQVKGTTILSITDVAGRTVITQTIHGSGNINISKLQSGIYFLKHNKTGETIKVFVSK